MNDQDNRGTNVLVLTSVFTALSFCTTFVRLLIRKLDRHLGWDDLAISIAVGFTLFALPFTVLAVKDGYGQHSSILSKAQSQNVLKWLFLIEFALFITLPLTKMSICFFILRIKNTGWLKWWLWTMMAGLVLTNLVPIIVLCAQCQPVRAYWDRGAGSCWDAKVYDIAIWIGVGKCK